MPVEPKDLAATLVARARRRREDDENARLEILRRLKASAPSEAASCGVGRVWVIGTVAWGSFGERSDVDLVVESGENTMKRVAFGDRIGELVGREVDVLPLSELPASFRARVEREGIRVA